jgi:hypothetical protein
MIPAQIQFFEVGQCRNFIRQSRQIILAQIEVAQVVQVANRYR